jgi:hypothetical protein
MPGGRPTKYDPKYCAEILRFFNKRVIERRKEVVEGKNWSRETIVREAVFFPSIEGFAARIGVATSTIYLWAEARYPEGHKAEGKLLHPEFSEAVARAQAKQHSLIYEHGFTGKLDSRLASLFAQSNMGLHTRAEDDSQQTIIIKHEDMADDHS